MIKPIAAYQIGQDRCLIFPWASGGNLLNYWEDFEQQRLSSDSVRWLLGQFKGVCSALEELHENNTRHGDLKPENILWFKDNNSRGMLQIADLGLAAFHEVEKHTNVRKGIQTITPSGTSRYEPPEMDKDRNTDNPRSRQYDIWSMGCVLLELLVWLIYGYDSFKQFKISTQHFWESYDRSDGKKYYVHSYADSCMRAMMTDLQGRSAYKDILSLVQTRLLVVEVSEIYESCPDRRDTAKSLRTAITDIAEENSKPPGYFAPVEETYPEERIRQQRRAVYQDGGSLAAPQRQDVPSSLPALTPTLGPSIDGNDGLRVMVRAPTGDINSSSLSSNASRNTEHQQVS